MLYKRWTRLALGIMLIAISVGGLAYWESSGRDKLMSEPVLVANRLIEAGEKISTKDFIVENMRKEHIAEGAFVKLTQLSGRDLTARVDIPCRGQVTATYFEEGRYADVKGASIFPIKNYWIDAVSSSLRGGDWINIYNQAGDILFGNFRVAFVKDKTYREVYDSDEEKTIEQRSLERTDGTGPVDSFEITASFEQYLELKKFVETTGGKLLVVQTFDNSVGQQDEKGEAV